MTENPIEHHEQETHPAITIRPQTADEEFDCLWSVLGKMPFYKANGYRVSIPDAPEFQALAQNPANIHEVNKPILKDLFVGKIYDASFFQPGIAALEAHRQMIEAAFPIFEQYRHEWGFKVFPQYEIRLNRYGLGGDSNPSEGWLRMLTKADGTFRRRHPTHSPHHELVHIGIEEAIVKKFDLNHWEKERVVDRICILGLDGQTTGYEEFPSSNKALDPFITQKSIHNLPGALAEYIAAYPRAK